MGAQSQCGVLNDECTSPVRQSRCKRSRDLLPHAQEPPSCGHNNGKACLSVIASAIMIHAFITKNGHFANFVLKTLHFKTIYLTQACNIPVLYGDFGMSFSYRCEVAELSRPLGETPLSILIFGRLHARNDHTGTPG